MAVVDAAPVEEEEVTIEIAEEKEVMIPVDMDVPVLASFDSYGSLAVCLLQHMTRLAVVGDTDRHSARAPAVEPACIEISTQCFETLVTMLIELLTTHAMVSLEYSNSLLSRTSTPSSLSHRLLLPLSSLYPLYLFSVPLPLF